MRNYVGRLFRERHPAQLISFAFAVAIVVGGLLLLLPGAKAGPGAATALQAFFTSTSAICVTGLVVVDTPTYWSPFGQAVIMVLIQAGGLGIMTLASILALLVARRLGLRGRLIAQAQTAAPVLSDVRRLLLGVVAFSFLFEAVAMTALTLRWWLGYDFSFGQAVWRGLFHAISAFNNAGFALWSDSLVGFVTDGWITLTVALALVCGGLGFPVWLELRNRVTDPRRWSLHTKLTLLTTFALVVFGLGGVLVFEWTNPATLGPLDTGGKLLAGFFQGVTPRTAGFNSIDYAKADGETLLVTDMLMFVGGGSASTAGGIKVTTFALLFLMIWAEIRGEPEVNTFGRRIAPHVQRQALVIAAIAVNAVVLTTLVMMADTTFPLSRVLFESLSAFGTVGLSTGITSQLPDLSQTLLIFLMFLGRIGPYTLAVALALRERERHYRFPEERPIIG